ncbi:Protein-lysine N-methyltransferase efm3 [Porphyridium purpureum]|uniref:Protein-lysine N-methyltransferase efm3 n=1 Tax=Porphyridium purpureum TaxID=35688 RepID=A0A5J4Z4Y0_PORPP|nr:Protein-lysine N-methyltransferase efm3 [Porphyridium purpureum]|eukprot:POR5106..scf295_1
MRWRCTMTGGHNDGYPQPFFEATVAQTKLASGTGAVYTDFSLAANGYRGIFWNASMAMDAALEGHIASWSGLRVLELGAGTGLLAIRMAQRGAYVLATDQNVDELLANVETARAPARVKDTGLELDVRLAVERVEWGLDAFQRRWRRSLQNQSPTRAELCAEDDTEWWDQQLRSTQVIVTVETVYDEASHDALLDTLVLIFQKSPSAVLYMSFLDRPFSMMFLVKLNDTRVDDSKFMVQPLSVMKQTSFESLHIYRITLAQRQ